jgi:DTW domain-containing protein
MDIETYKLKRAQLQLQEPKYRTICTTCAQPDFCCYCKHVSTFDPKINFVVLIHPIEVKRRIATGRMSHLCLQGSYLIKGQDYTHNVLVNELLQEDEYHSVMLYPGPTSQNISTLQETEKENLFPKNKKLRIFVIDGTWATARKMTRQSENLKNLPRFCFSPTKPSNFRVRKQPKPNCYSTIEAIHHTIELLGRSRNFNVEERTHDQLLSAFNYMVERQLDFIKESHRTLRASTYRREGQLKCLLPFSDAAR